MKKFLPALIAAGVATGLTTAHAADAVIEADPEPPIPVTETSPELSLWYVAARVGAGFADDSDFNTLATNVENSYNTGYALSGAFGREFDTGTNVRFRAEAEIGYNAFEVEKHNIAGVGVSSGSSASGDTNTLYGLVNAYADYDLGVIQPFVSAGIGYASLEFDGHGTTGTGTVLDDSGEGLAWQVGTGVAYSVSDTLKLDLGYRYMKVEDVELRATDGTNTDVDFSNHQVTLGIRKLF